MEGLVKSFFVKPVRHALKLMGNKAYRRFCITAFRYKHHRRYKKINIITGGFRLIVPDVLSFLYSLYEIFVEEIYKFETTETSPVIIDVGANIGLSTLYFKKQFPEAEITAFEADPDIFNYLKKNLEKNKVTDVNIINKAVWKNEEKITFHTEGADGGRIGLLENAKTREVDAVLLSDYLKNKKIDFLKIDIEGAEIPVLRECREYLKNVENIFIEYHSFAGQEQKLEDVLIILAENNFRYYFENTGVKSKTPFIKINKNLDMDLQINIFGYRTK